IMVVIVKLEMVVDVFVQGWLTLIGLRVAPGTNHIISLMAMDTMLLVAMSFR
uniref:Uncharacterized protein n=1 Tax=Oncorhynchus kisutch TaxID=8019 RepID=A0A8C7CEZ4_ONCKI